jgi:hypothetical protein
VLGHLPLSAGTRWAGPGVVLGELEQQRGTFFGAEPLLDAFVRLSGLIVENARTERALGGYDGTVLLVTHDRLFLERFGATRTIAL